MAELDGIPARIRSAATILDGVSSRLDLSERSAVHAAVLASLYANGELNDPQAMILLSAAMPDMKLNQKMNGKAY